MKSDSEAEAPKGPDIPAQGIALGWDERELSALKGRHNGAACPAPFCAGRSGLNALFSHTQGDALGWNISDRWSAASIPESAQLDICTDPHFISQLLSSH
jgi:hypothetical protein